MVNQKAIDIIDSTNLNAIDIKILCFCYDKVYSVSGLQRELGIAYKNLLPHLRRLEKAGLILIKNFGRGKNKEIRTNIEDLGVHYFMFGLIALWTYPNILKKDKKLQKEIKRFLKENQTQ